MTYYARLSFNANGGSGAPSPQIAFTDTPNTSTSITIPSTVPTRQYYTFMGWNVNSSAPSGYAAGSSYPVRTSDTADLANARQYTTYATWKRKTIVVTYNANGGSNAPTSQTVNMYEWFTLRSGSPTRQYYDFLGWATSASATTAQYQPSASARFTSNVTLYAVWKKSADVISASNGTMGSAMSLTITKADVSFTDDITYQFGSATGTIVSGTTLTTISWTPPTTLAAQIPNASSGSLVLTCKTYNGGTLVGTTTKTVTLSVPQSLAPTASVTIADNDATCLSWGVYVQSRSTLTFTISATGQQSATISSYRTTVNGTQYTSATFTTDVLLYNGSNSYTIVVTDSRGLQTTVTGTFNVEAYAVPSVTLVSCDRNDSDAEQVDVTFDFTVASVSNNNSAQYALDYKKKSSNTWTQGTAVSCGGYYGTISDSLSGIDQGDEYDIRVRVIDAFAEASVETEVGASGNIMLHSRHIGGAGLLMKSQAENQLDVGKKTVFHETVDVIPRRAYATLSSAGWYRVLTYDSYHSDRVLGDVAYRINITIFDWARQMHEISFVCLWGSIKWIDEKSVTTNTNFIDKIRYTQNGAYGYIDVHYTDSSSRKLSCHFDVKADYDSIQSEISANDFVAVADAPVGETILTTYNFHANTSALDSIFTFYSTANNVKTLTIPLSSSTWQCGLAIGNVNGAGNVCCLVLISGSPSIATLGVSGTVNVLTASVSSGVLTLGLSNASYTFKTLTVIGLF